MSKRPLVPNFLQRMDDRLLRNKPGIWQTRTHLVLWFTFLCALALSTCCYLAFNDAKQYYSVDVWVGFTVLAISLGIIAWLLFLLRFNVFKRFGQWQRWDGLKSFALYFTSIAAMVGICFIPPAIQSYRANQQFTSNEIVADANEMNLVVCQLEYGNLLPIDWNFDTVQVVNQLQTDPMMEVDTALLAVGELIYRNRNHYTYTDTADFRYKMQYKDSLVRLNDSMYITYTCQNYEFVNAIYASAFANTKYLSSKDLFDSVVRHFKKTDPAKLQARLSTLRSKYAARGRYGYSSDDEEVNIHAPYDVRISKKYGLNSVNDGITNITDKKYEWQKNWDFYLRVFYYSSLFLSLLVFVFRHTTVKTFFLSWLAAIVLSIFTGLLIGMARGGETVVYSSLLFYYLVFLVLALSIAQAKVRQAAKGIALNLFLILTPFVPIIGLGQYMAIEYAKYYGSGVRPDEWVDPVIYMPIAEVAGSFIFLVLLEPVFRKLYRKWYAAPEF